MGSLVQERSKLKKSFLSNETCHGKRERKGLRAKHCPTVKSTATAAAAAAAAPTAAASFQQWPVTRCWHDSGKFFHSDICPQFLVEHDCFHEFTSKYFIWADLSSFRLLSQKERNILHALLFSHFKEVKTHYIRILQ